MDLRLGKHGLDGRGKPGQVIRTGNEDVLNSPVSQAVQHSGPELGALVFADPHTEHVLLAVQVDAYGDVYRLFHDLSFAANMVVDGVQKYHRVDRLQRSLLPVLRYGKDLIRDPAHRRI